MNEPEEPARIEDEAQQRRISYNRLVRQARLVSIDLKSVQFRVDSVLPPKVERKSFYERRMREFFFINEENAIACEIEWIVEVKHKRKCVVKCAAVYRVYYDGFNDVGEDIAKLYAENVAFASTYTYFRSLYATLDWSAGIASPPLPIIKFVPKV